jgi:hypothetical protein
MYNLIAHVFQRILRILTSLPIILRLTTYLTRRRSRRPMTLTYFRDMSYRTLNCWVRSSSIKVPVPLVPNIQLIARRRMIHQAPPPECQRRKHLSTQGMSSLVVKSDQKTHSTCLILEEYLLSVNVFFYFRDYSLYFSLFERLYFIFFIYDMKLRFYYLWFEIKLLYTFKNTKSWNIRYRAM